MGSEMLSGAQNCTESRTAHYLGALKKETIIQYSTVCTYCIYPPSTYLHHQTEQNSSNLSLEGFYYKSDEKVFFPLSIAPLFLSQSTREMGCS